ncbi:ABC transporter substrate-binding protein [Ornithinimicrobium sp. LYQ121]|uniref:ABC transporter substrate-binding protein n=1 Tax=Ornithinimicrobium sp. LYQ121 TaxID=3378801 RepID=UPI0038526895
MARPTPPLSRRSVLALGGSATLGALLSSCTGGAPPGLTPTGEAETTAGGPRPALAHWYHQYPEEGRHEAATRYAEAYSAADVTVSWRPGDYARTTAEALLTPAGPDVFEYANGPTIDMIRGEQVVDLTDVFGRELSDFPPALVERVTWDGRIYAVPQVVSTQLLVYRRSMLDQAGIAPPQQMEQLLESSRALTRDDVKGLFLGADGGAGRMGGPMLWAGGFDFLDDESVGFDNAGAAESLAVLRTLWTDEVLLLDASDDWTDPTPLTAGRVAMQWTELSAFPRIRERLGDDFGAVPWPSMPGGAPSVPVTAYAASVSALARDIDAAREYVRWLWVDSPDHQLDFATSHGLGIPARISVAADAEALASGPEQDAATYVAEHGRSLTPLLWTDACASAWGEMMTRIVHDGSDPQEELDALVPVVEAELDRVTA